MRHSMKNMHRTQLCEPNESSYHSVWKLFYKMYNINEMKQKFIQPFATLMMTEDEADRERMRQTIHNRYILEITLTRKYSIQSGALLLLLFFFLFHCKH